MVLSPRVWGAGEKQIAELHHSTGAALNSSNVWLATPTSSSKGGKLTWDRKNGIADPASSSSRWLT
jgi:hypothetical protein